LLVSLLFPLAAAGHEHAATVTLVEGGSALLQGPRGTVPAMGVRLHHADIVQTGPDFTYADVEDWLMGDLEVRQALVPAFRAKASDPDFRAALIQNMQHHAEWNAIIGR
jgi:hypothetical protein